MHARPNRANLVPSVGTSGDVTDMQDSSGAQVVETHISVLFFVADRVYKLRKPVRFGFLDFTERTARELDCHREVALNRRLAPDVYLGVADVAIEGVPVDHMVVMRALPRERRLAALARGGGDVAG
jgi:aminoglycoside phosphotransferase family enzyme